MKQHKKMYRSGKLWLTATITLGMIGFFGGESTANADELVSPTYEETNQTTVIKNQSETHDLEPVANNETQSVISTDKDNSESDSQTITNSSEDEQKNSDYISAGGATLTPTVSASYRLAASQPGNKWSYFSSGWSYTDSNGNWLYNKWQKIGDSWYYFNNYGYAQTGWYKSNAGNWYYFDNNGTWADTNWQQINNHWYYFDPTNAWAVTGWQYLGNRWYYFDPINTWADTNWQKLNNRWYYFDPVNTWARTGWQQINNHWYYFDLNNSWALTGLQRINQHNYYFDPINAWAVTGWRQLNGHWYYFDLNNTWADTGWQKLNNSWYYFDLTNGQALTGWQTIGQHLYYFDSVNAWANTGWQLLNGNWYYFDPNNAWAMTGWQYLDNSWYYFDPNNSEMYTGTHVIDGKEYTFSANGQMLNQDSTSSTTTGQPGNSTDSTGNQTSSSDQGSTSSSSTEPVDPEANWQTDLNDFNPIKIADPALFSQAFKDYMNLKEGLSSEEKTALWKMAQSNTYLNNKAAAIKVDINHVTPEQTKELSLYAAKVLNSIRDQLGIPRVIVTKGALKFAQDVVTNYQKDNWSKADHDESGISRAAGKNGLQTGGNYYEDAGFFSANPDYVTMDELRCMIYKSLNEMLFGSVQGEVFEMLHTQGILGTDFMTGDIATGQSQYFAVNVSQLANNGYFMVHLLNISYQSPYNEVVSPELFDTTEVD